MAKRLKNVSVNSVDLCKQGANQRAYICLKKNMEEDENVQQWKVKLAEEVCKALGIAVEQQTEEEKIKKAMTESLQSILKDESKTEEQKNDLIQKSVKEFFETTLHFARENEMTVDMEKQQQCNEKEEKEEMDVTKMTKEDKELYKQLQKKYEQTEEQWDEKQQKTTGELHPEVKKMLEEAKAAQEELEELKKSLEIKELETVAKQYEILGKDSVALAKKLYELKKADITAYEDYIATLDEMAAMTETTGIFKEYGSNRGNTGTKKQQAEQRIQELMKADTSLTYAEAFTRVCEESEALKKALE